MGLAGLLLIAAFAGVWFFRERLFVAAYERDSLWGMRALLRIDGKLGRTRPDDWVLWNRRTHPVVSRVFSPLVLACEAQQRDVVELILVEADLEKNDLLCAAHMLLYDGRVAMIESLGELLPSSLWLRFANSAFWPEASEEFLFNRGATYYAWAMRRRDGEPIPHPDSGFHSSAPPPRFPRVTPEPAPPPDQPVQNSPPDSPPAP